MAKLRRWRHVFALCMMTTVPMTLTWPALRRAYLREKNRSRGEICWRFWQFFYFVYFCVIYFSVLVHKSTIQRKSYLNTAAETRIFQVNEVSTIAVDALAPCVARTSAAMVLIIQDKWILIFHGESISTTCTISVLRNDGNCNYVFIFLWS